MMASITASSVTEEVMSTQDATGAGAGAAGRGGRALSAAQAARAERQRLRARELLAARLACRPVRDEAGGEGGRALVCAGGERLLDTGGGFLLPATEAPADCPRPAPAPAAPPPLRSEWPLCEECGERFPTSWLLETFSYSACESCRDPEPEGRHELVPRTQAKREYLLQDCDLDLREPPLRSLRRRNPHRLAGRGASSDMRLYLRLQLQQRALLVWGSLDRLDEQRREREEKRERQASKKYVKEIRALRMAARGTLYARGAGEGGHVHTWGGEEPCAAEGEDMYERVCTDCGHRQLYEKM